MKLPFLLFLIMLFDETLSCQEVYNNKTRAGGYSLRYDYSRGRYASYDTIVNNCTIVCSNIYTIGEIYYSYKERMYDQFLKIEKSNVSSLNANELASYPTVLKLFLSGIHIQTIQPGAFNGLIKLEELYLDSNDLKKITIGIFTSLQRLEVLDLSNNKIEKIEKLALLGATALRKLYLQNNKLLSIEDNMFDNLSHLTYLDLSGNPLDKVPANGLSNLDYLIAGNTSIREFTVLANTNLTMKVLNLTGSQMDSVDFAKFPDVETLDLSNNNIAILENCQNVRTLTLHLNNNRIKTIPTGFRNVSYLNLANNQLESIKSSFFANSRSIILVNFSSNNISFIESTAFRNLSSLNGISLQNNNVNKIDPILFTDLTNMRFLDLSYNNIKELAYGTFNNLQKLFYLDISHNKIVNLHPSLFYSLSNLETLNFGYNNISSFDVKDLSSHLSSIGEIILDGNPWKCKQLAHMNHLLKNMSITIKEGNSYEIENFKGIACENDKSVVTNNTDEAPKTLLIEFKSILNETLKNSQLENFLNEGFKNSNFFQFFQQNFTNVLPAEKPVEVKTASLVEPPRSDRGILIMSLLLQIIMCLLMVFMAFIMFIFMRRLGSKQGMHRISHVELSEDY